MKQKRTILYGGLLLLGMAVFLRWIGLSSPYWELLFGAGILLKVLFLVLTIRAKESKFYPWLCFLLPGVVLMLLSLLLKAVFPDSIIRMPLFIGSITLKTIGLLLIIFTSKNK